MTSAAALGLRQDPARSNGDTPVFLPVEGLGLADASCANTHGRPLGTDSSTPAGGEALSTDLVVMEPEPRDVSAQEITRTRRADVRGRA
ncbi:hypothetical protein ACFWHL_18150 [Streptomyces massasporeus]